MKRRNIAQRSQSDSRVPRVPPLPSQARRHPLKPKMDSNKIELSPKLPGVSPMSPVVSFDHNRKVEQTNFGLNRATSENHQLHSITETSNNDHVRINSLQYCLLAICTIL